MCVTVCVFVWVAADDDVVAGAEWEAQEAEEGCLLYMPEQHGRPGQLLSIEHELPCSAEALAVAVALAASYDRSSCT